MDFRFGPSDFSNELGNTHLPQLTPLSTFSQAQQQLQHHPTPHILPPLHSRHSISSIPRSSFDLTADAISTPQSAGLLRSAAPHDIFGHGPHYSPVGDHSSIPALRQPGPIFPDSPLYAGAVSSSQAHPQIIAQALSQVRLPDLRPMPPEGMTLPLSLSDQVPPQQTPVGDLERPPTHVVGSQGRRGILPSAPGRAAAVAGSSASNGKSTTVPTKDADGKFPCPYCSKTYLHAKHLKRHLLRRESGCNTDSVRSLILPRYWRPSIHVRSLQRHLFTQRYPQKAFLEVLAPKRQPYRSQSSFTLSSLSKKVPTGTAEVTRFKCWELHLPR